ncbi:acyltransferase family protein [Blastococcus haudaquaticus]|uniref:Peptidoglycan/LPS O-acetylase OafA/YrhL, contains acyltransferase and SGNH-hydrolase domains n=1 Tax=Blastococcus haudaquaticus TaxID=1938745 RepID=A0A286GY75_9ACTN|nr:acyltransferase [Blastococcus haudaquaticus]SOE00442.1 Peptidoglycan/LPS O-acetylase OafA/YrhL, contains acyltransferase and SGNH-hydrolase domains [Blastococcus haudaquaticus]
MGQDGGAQWPVAPATGLPEPPRPTIDALTGLRILAAVWVVLFHLRSTDVMPGLLPASERLAWFVGGGYVGVDLFFTLSGFVIAYNYLDGFQRLSGRAYVRFLYLRLARIYPLHLATLLAVLLLVVVARVIHVALSDESAFGVGSFVANVFLVHAWGGEETSWNYPAWSISAEWFAYLLFPLIAVAFARFGVRTAARAAVGVLVTLALGLPLIDATADSEGIPLVRVSVEFLAGCFLFVLHRHSRRRGGLHAWLLPVAFLLVGVLTWWSDARTMVVAPALVLVVWSASLASGPVAAWLASRPMVFAGQVSFALYMTHAIVLLVLKNLVPPEAFAGTPLVVRCSVLAGYCVVMAVTAVAAYLVVERPSQAWMRRRLARSAG